MKIFFVHHALRVKGNPPGPNDNIHKLGVRDAKLTAVLLKRYQKMNGNLKAIYTSPYYRCSKTAELINKYVKVPITRDDRLNEMNISGGESWLSLQKRVRECLTDILNSFTENDCVVCVTSGVNIAGFISLAYKLKPSDSTPFITMPSCSPIVFEINKSCL